MPQGVSGAIKRRGGLEPFREIAKHGPIPLGEAVLTGAGKLPFKAIIHATAINGFWRASESSIRAAVQNSMRIVNEQGFKSVGFPLLGSGSGGFNQAKAEAFMKDEFSKIISPARVVIVRFKKANA